MTRQRGAAGLLLVVTALAVSSWEGTARGEAVLARTDGGTEFFTDGRIGGFFQAVWGQTLPTGFDANGVLLHTVGDGGVNIAGLYKMLPMGAIGQGDVRATRVRSGFLPNIFGFGMRKKLTDRTTLTGYMAIWANIENENERSFVPLFPDAREGWLRIDGPGGSLTVGRSLTLFSRGATQVDFLYGHRYGVGNPAGFDSQGPAGGFVGYGVLASTFEAGIVYATPSFHGLMLTAGYFDPSRFVGLFWDRTELGRPEAEATYDHLLGQLGLVHLFANGAFQKVYATGSARSDNVWGVGWGGRLELSIFRLGVAGHYGQGLGFDYALSGSNAVVEMATSQALRKFDGYYVQTMVVLGHVDVSAGAGVTRVHEVLADVTPDPMTGMVAVSVLKQRLGLAAGVVYHISDSLHLDVDYFRADAKWWLGESQVVNTISAGMTLTW